MQIQKKSEPFGFKAYYNECIIKGKRQVYDACSSETPLRVAKKYYKNFVYIGSGNTTFHNGVKFSWPKIHHFFKRK